MRGDDPRDVLDAVRRMEGELARVRASAEPAAERDDIAQLRTEIEEGAARERTALVEDLEILLGVMEAGWRRTQADIGRLADEIASLRESVEGTRDAIADARIEVRLTGAAASGIERNGRSARVGPWPESPRRASPYDRAEDGLRGR
jgi:hypothetical protein